MRNGQVKERKAEDRVSELNTRLKVDFDKHFTGFDAFQKLINSGVDIAMLTTPPGCRPRHFEVAIKAGKHVFAQNPITMDPVGCRRPA